MLVTPKNNFVHYLQDGNLYILVSVDQNVLQVGGKVTVNVGKVKAESIWRADFAKEFESMGTIQVSNSFYDNYGIITQHRLIDFLIQKLGTQFTAVFLKNDKNEIRGVPNTFYSDMLINEYIQNSVLYVTLIE